MANYSHVFCVEMNDKRAKSGDVVVNGLFYKRDVSVRLRQCYCMGRNFLAL